MSITKLSATLTQAVAPTTYTSVSNPIYRRTPAGSVLLATVGSGTVRVFQSKDSFTATWNLNYSNQSNAFDDNLSTYASYTVPAGQPETDALTVDFGAVDERYIHVRLLSSASNLYHRVYISSDGSSWMKVLETNTTTATSYVFKGIFRYVKITVLNTDSTYVNTSYINEVSGFGTGSAFFTRTVSLANRVVIDEIQPNPYWLWVDPSPSLTVSVFERAPPSSAGEIWVL
ncbi:MAG: hypothetical protein QXT84_04405 [Candidatus Bathyarchaeia archaeon]